MEGGTHHTIAGLVTVLLAIIGVAILAELVSLSANTGGVLKAGSGALSQALCTALSPITGKSCVGTSVSSSITFGGQVPTTGKGTLSPDCFLSGNC